MKTIARHTFLPIFMTLNGFAIWLVGSGSNHWWLGTLFVLAIFLSFVFERIVPYNPSFNDAVNDQGRDIAHAIVNETSNLVSVLSIPVLVALLDTSFLWPSHLPFWVQCLAAVLFADLGITLAHYASHKWGWLWRFHAVHHSVERLYGFNGLMKHPLHQAIEGLVGVTPLVVLGMPLDVGLVLIFMIALQLLLQHSNVNYYVGPLRWLLAVNCVHRFHHQKWAHDGDVNFGLFTTIGDHVLGTYYFDQQKKFGTDDLGIGTDPTFPRPYLAQLLAPFTRQ